MSNFNLRLYDDIIVAFCFTVFENFSVQSRSVMDFPEECAVLQCTEKFWFRKGSIKTTTLETHHPPQPLLQPALHPPPQHPAEHPVRIR